MNLDEAGGAGEETFSRTLWHAAPGDAAPYPGRSMVAPQERPGP